MIKIKATFKGSNGSLGYELDKEYELILRHENGGKIFIIPAKQGTLRCPYSNMLALMRNWDNIRRA
jgi:hypothetical protein